MIAVVLVAVGKIMVKCMVVIKREMSLVERSSVGGGNFWGLVQQKGPWKTTKNDVENARASMKQDKVFGGGIGVYCIRGI